MRRRVFAVGLLFLSGLAPIRAAAINTGTWNEFSFTDVGVQARGCFPADMDATALDCIPSSAGNSVFAPAPPWTFTLKVAAPLIVTDAFLHGDSFDIKDNGALIFSTPNVATDGNGCGDNPVTCLADPRASHGSFFLAAGPHSITIFPNAIADAGAAYFEIAPEPSSLMLLMGALAAFGLMSRIRARIGRSS
jgi:hypothetical protein